MGTTSELHRFENMNRFGESRHSFKFMNQLNGSFFDILFRLILQTMKDYDLPHIYEHFHKEYVEAI